MDQNNGQIVTWLITHSGGSIKDSKQANSVLVGFAIVVFVISIFLFTKSIGSKESSSAATGTHPPVTQKVPYGFAQ